MCTEHRNWTWTLMPLLLSGVLCQMWTVEYQQAHICAVKGSSVVISCLFYYPNNKKVQSVMWGHERNSIFMGPFIFDSESVSQSSHFRFQYIGDKKQNCSFKIHQVEHNDTGKYVFRFKTNSKEGQWTGQQGSILKIVDLEAVATKMNGGGAVREGDSVNLTCMNRCDGGSLSSAFTWFKNGGAMSEGPVLFFSNISSMNSGNYTCSLREYNGTTSGVINVNVGYGPKNTSGSVRPSTEVDVGSKVTLECTSHANPPVEHYIWFKIYDHDIISVGNKSELHFMEVVPSDGGQYICSTTNKHGSQNSSIVTLKVKVDFPFSTFTRNVFIIAAAATVTALLIATTVIAFRRLSQKRTRAPETDCEEDIQNAAYLNWPVFDDGQPQDGNWCEETSEIIYTTIDFTKRMSNMHQQTDSHNCDEGVIYSTVCRDHILNPFIH